MDIIVGAGSLKDRVSIPLATRQGNHIPNERRPERSPASLNASVEIFKKEHPNAKPRSKTAIYNCMGLIFASRRTWIDPIFIETIFEDDEYYKLEDEKEAQPSDVVIYRDSNSDVLHLATILTIEPRVKTASFDITVVSKWGADAEYIHAIDDLPGLLKGDMIEFWTERR